MLSRKSTCKRPQDWDKAVSAAYLRLLGATQLDASFHTGMAERTIVAWEASPWWPMAEAEARMRWLKGGDALAMTGLLRAIKGHGPEAATTARWWAERRIREFQPPSQRLEHTGAAGSPLPVQHVTIELVDPSAKKA